MDLATAKDIQGSYDESVSLLKAAQEIASKLGNPHIQLKVLGDLGNYTH